jgi:hypothetical protein
MKRAIVVVLVGLVMWLLLVGGLVYLGSVLVPFLLHLIGR